MADGLPFDLPPFDTSKLLVAATASAGLGVVAVFLTASLPSALAVFACSLAIGAAAVFAEPALLAARSAQEQEADMVLRLKQVAVCLDSGISFDSSLRAASGGGAFGRELSAILLERGGDVGRSLALAAARSPSPLCRRALLHLAVAASTGRSSGLKRLASEAMSLQLSRLREFSSKQAFYGVFFVAASAILPAGFAARAAVGSAFLAFEVSPGTVLGAFVVAFPLLNAALLALLYLQRPVGSME